MIFGRMNGIANQPSHYVSMWDFLIPGPILYLNSCDNKSLITSCVSGRGNGIGPVFPCVCLSVSGRSHGQTSWHTDHEETAKSQYITCACHTGTVYQRKRTLCLKTILDYSRGRCVKAGAFSFIIDLHSEKWLCRKNGRYISNKKHCQLCTKWFLPF